VLRAGDQFQEQTDLLFNGLNLVAECCVFRLHLREPLPEVLYHAVTPPLDQQLDSVQSQAFDVEATCIGECNQ